MRRLPLLAIALASLGVLAAGGCTNRLDHVFGGYAYDAAHDCLATSGAIDVIAGAQTAPCSVVHCWQAPDGSIYVTDTACDAPIDFQDHTQDGSGPCVKALAAYARTGHGLCAGAGDGGTEGGDGG